jgi:hypothetical protein
MVKAFAIFLADTFLVLQMPINILPLNKHSLDTFPNTPDANCETVIAKWLTRTIKLYFRQQNSRSFNYYLKFGGDNVETKII